MKTPSKHQTGKTAPSANIWRSWVGISELPFGLFVCWFRKKKEEKIEEETEGSFLSTKPLSQLSSKMELALIGACSETPCPLSRVSQA